MKDKILFMIINMNIGGTEKALLNMISTMDKNKYDVTILMLEKKGGFLKFIPEHVNIKYVQGYSTIKPLLNNPPLESAMKLLRKGKVLKTINFILFHILAKVIKNRTIIFNYLAKDIEKLNIKYDTAIAYAGPMDFISYFILKKTSATRKIQWVHFDVNKVGFNCDLAKKLYKSFDNIFVVSEEAKKKLIDKIPSIRRRTEVKYNKVSPSIVEKQSNIGKGFEDIYNGVRILTVGRLSPEKGHDVSINVLSRLIKEGHVIKWFVLGEGKSRAEYESRIKKLNLDKNFILLGADPNPYTYMKQCDIYVQPSRYEGYCITLLEAKVLNKPIIATSVNGVKEQLTSGVNGLIVNVDEDDLYKAVKKLVIDRELREKLSLNLINEKAKLNDKKVVI
ncbi:glycosyltransferase [Halobacillus andaensis]|uniref:glycosyltransferase n=1 Tax=Halobacillus andaensis TaxID=1176239 RepID=UPI003D7029AD